MKKITTKNVQTSTKTDDWFGQVCRVQLWVIGFYYQAPTKTTSSWYPHARCVLSEIQIHRTSDTPGSLGVSLERNGDEIATATSSTTGLEVTALLEGEDFEAMLYTPRDRFSVTLSGAAMTLNGDVEADFGIQFTFLSSVTDSGIIVAVLDEEPLPT